MPGVSCSRPEAVGKLLLGLLCYVFSINGVSCVQDNYGYTNKVCIRGRYPVSRNPCMFLCRTMTASYYFYYPDGTQCVFSHRPFVLGRCWSGVCRKGASRPPRPSHCKPPNHKGYARGCQFPCRDGTRRVGAYPDETTCINVNSNDKREGVAGVCRNGECVEYYLLDKPEATIAVQRVFAKEYEKCPEKEHVGRNALSDCHNFCKSNGDWYFGYYTSNSTCQMPTVNRLGWCCGKDCHREKYCGKKSKIRLLRSATG
ncbi:uncharacterized protein LOC142768985 isoform X2 [Rhipicephalus microplus]|uniref:uncharacterized protein LOC142768985 isoform X2 n=1 Tax=Rhipicephalus microplus TaxID=6941 RepID=UPI003F6B8A48